MSSRDLPCGERVQDRWCRPGVLQSVRPRLPWAAGAILLFGHGRGKANASHQWVAYVEKHRPDVAAKVVADIRIDIDHLDDTQVLRLAQYYFGAPLVRDFGDARWGEPSGSKPES